MLQSLMAVIAVLAGAAATYFFQVWRAKRERRNVLFAAYLAQLQDACESLWHRLKNLAYERASVASDEAYLVTTTMYTLGRTLGLERMLALEGLYPEIWTRFPQLKGVLSRRLIDDAVQKTTADRGAELQHYDRVALAEAAVERHDDGFRPSTFLEFRRRIEGPDSAWWKPAREAVTALEDSRDDVAPLMETLALLAVELSQVTQIKTSVDGQSPRVPDASSTDTRALGGAPSPTTARSPQGSSRCSSPPRGRQTIPCSPERSSSVPDRYR